MKFEKHLQQPLHFAVAGSQFLIEQSRTTRSARIVHWVIGLRHPRPSSRTSPLPLRSSWRKLDECSNLRTGTVRGGRSGAERRSRLFWWFDKFQVLPRIGMEGTPWRSVLPTRSSVPPAVAKCSAGAPRPIDHRLRNDSSASRSSSEVIESKTTSVPACRSCWYLPTSRLRCDAILRSRRGCRCRGRR